MKIIKKSKLQVKDGYIVNKKGKVLVPDWEVLEEYRLFAITIQKAVFIEDQEWHPAAVPTLKGFKFNMGEDKFTEDVDTPNLDEAVEKGAKIFEEIKRKDEAQRISKEANKFLKLAAFCEKNEAAFDNGHATVLKAQYPGMPNLLELTVEDIMTVLSGIDWDKYDAATNEYEREMSHIPVCKGLDVDGDKFNLFNAVTTNATWNSAATNCAKVNVRM